MRAASSRGRRAIGIPRVSARRPDIVGWRDLERERQSIDFSRASEDREPSHGDATAVSRPGDEERADKKSLKKGSRVWRRNKRISPSAECVAFVSLCRTRARGGDSRESQIREFERESEGRKSDQPGSKDDESGRVRRPARSSAIRRSR